jgi:predicted AAA+ superfamily ATPase
MVMIGRIVKPLISNSFFLFGARGTGKTSLLRELFKDKRTLWIDLLMPSQEETYQLRPEALAESVDALSPRPEWVIIDEVQRAPKLLDVVHSLIEADWNRKRELKFALTGSSARKLKRGAANLLAGRAFTFNLYPLTYCELGDRFNLMRALTWGTLPTVCNVESDEERQAYLRSYTSTYVKEEVAQEQLVRNLIPFRKFLPIAAQCSGTIVNYNSIARELGVDWTTVRTYFDILEDTLLGFKLPAYSRSVRKQQLSAPKFYLFDIGIKRALDKTLSLEPATNQLMGPLFEHFVICEVLRLNDYLQKDFNLSYLTTQGGAEIDLIIERPGARTLFVEIKSTERVTTEHIRHVRDLSAGRDDIEPLCVSREGRRRMEGGVLILPWQEAFEHMGLSTSSRT